MELILSTGILLLRNLAANIISSSSSPTYVLLHTLDRMKENDDTKLVSGTRVSSLVPVPYSMAVHTIAKKQIQPYHGIPPVRHVGATKHRAGSLCDDGVIPSHTTAKRKIQKIRYPVAMEANVLF